MAIAGGRAHHNRGEAHWHLASALHPICLWPAVWEPAAQQPVLTDQPSQAPVHVSQQFFGLLSLLKDVLAELLQQHH